MFKHAIVNSRLGAMAIGLRDRLALHRAVGGELEAVGTAASDLISRVLLERLCREGHVFVDVGAHIGSVINGARLNSAPSQIIAVEAIPEKADRLRRRFPEAVIHACAVGDQHGTISFYVDEVRPGFSSLDPAVAANSRAREISVPIRRLDELVPADQVDLIKIDVEGAELGVLRGATTVTERSRPTYIFESGAEEMTGFAKADLWQWLHERNYAVLVPNRVAHQDPGLTLDGFLEGHLYPRRTTNYVAVARERRDEVRRRARQVLGLH